jgi:hypothetical protein
MPYFHFWGARSFFANVKLDARRAVIREEDSRTGKLAVDGSGEATIALIV